MRPSHSASGRGPDDISIINDTALRQIVQAGRHVVVTNLTASCTLQDLGEEAFDDALSETRHMWLQEAINATDVLRPASEVYGHFDRREQVTAHKEAYHQVVTHFTHRMVQNKHWILRQARAKFLDRAERVAIQVFRNRIEIVDVYSNKYLQRDGKQ